MSRQIQECNWIAKLLAIYSEFGEVPGLNFPRTIYLWITPGGNVLLPELRIYQSCLNTIWAELHDGYSHESMFNISWSRLGGLKRNPQAIEWSEEVYRSHRSKLLTKDYGYYKSAFEREGIPLEEPHLSYHWEAPTIKGGS